MHLLRWQQFLEPDSLREFDHRVSLTTGIDHFCSSSYWTVPAAKHIMPAGSFIGARLDNADIALSLGVTSDGARILHPLEAAWCLSSPVVGASGEQAIARDFLSFCKASEQEWDALMLAGVTAHSALFRSLLGVLGSRYALRKAEETSRCIASLEEGIDGYLSRRSRGFRKNLRKAERRFDENGMSLVDLDSSTGLGVVDAEDVFERILEVENRCWKSQEGGGLLEPTMRRFYSAMLPMLLRDGRGLVSFALDDKGIDRGYILGGYFAGRYRGLQFSFDDAFRTVSLGSVLQWHHIKRMAAAGCHFYDFGTEMAYKLRWAEILTASPTLIALKA